MMKTPRGENARLISNVHLEHDTPASYPFEKGGDAR